MVNKHAQEGEGPQAVHLRSVCVLRPRRRWVGDLMIRSPCSFLNVSTNCIGVRSIASIRRSVSRDPLGVSSIPLHRVAQAVREGNRRPPVEFRFDFVAVDGVSAVVAWPIGDITDQRLGFADRFQQDMGQARGWCACSARRCCRLRRRVLFARLFRYRPRSDGRIGSSSGLCGRLRFAGKYGAIGQVHGRVRPAGEQNVQETTHQQRSATNVGSASETLSDAGSSAVICSARCSQKELRSQQKHQVRQCEVLQGQGHRPPHTIAPSTPQAVA